MRAQVILETPTVHSRYSFVIPAQRKSYFYLSNWVAIVMMVQIMAYGVFRFPATSPVSLEAKDLLSQLLRVDPAARPAPA